MFIKIVLVKVCSSLLLLSFFFNPVLAFAATNDLNTMQQQLTLMQKILELLKPAPIVLGASIISVSNDQELFNALGTVQGGETIALAPGIYSRIFVRSDSYAQYSVGSLKKSGGTAVLTSPVKITSANLSNRAIIQGLEFRQSNNWQIEGVSIFPVDGGKAALLSGNNLKFNNNNISFGESDNWDAATWLSKTKSAIEIKGNNIEVGYNYLKNIQFGITVTSGDGAYVHHNYITNMTGDGMRGLGNNSRFEHNFITNPILADPGNHYDGFQSWSTGSDGKTGTGVVTGTQFRNNTILYQTKSDPLRADMQGIGMFDGQFKDWVIENNLVVVNHYHAISVYGPIDSVIQNNVGIDFKEGSPGPAWVKYFNHKNGTIPVNSVVRNNFSNSALASSTGVTVENHTVVPYAEYGKYFTNPSAGDFSVKSGTFPFNVGASINMSQLAPEPKFVSASVAVPPVIVATTTATTTPPVVTPPPVVVIPTSVNLDGLSGTLHDDEKIEAEVVSSVVPSSVAFWLDGILINTDIVAPYYFSNVGTDKFDTTKIIDGTHTLEAKVIIGTTTISEIDTFTVLNTEEPDPEVIEEDTPPIPPVVVTEYSVYTTSDLKVRASAGGAVLGVQPSGAKAIVKIATRSTNNDIIWIYADFETGLDGYVSEKYLHYVSDLTISPDKQSLLLVLLKEVLRLTEILRGMLASS